MSNVTKITSSRKMQLPRLEDEIAELYEVQRKAQWQIGEKLLEIKEGKEWQHQFEFFDAYLEDFNVRLTAQSVHIGIAELKRFLNTAEFALAIATGKAPKKWQAFFSKQPPRARDTMRQIARALIKDSAEPISEAAAFTIACREGYFGTPTQMADPEYKPTVRSLEDRIADRTRRRVARDPDVVAHAIRYRLDSVLEELDHYEWDDKSFRGAIQDAELRSSARRLHKLLGEILSIKSTR